MTKKHRTMKYNGINLIVRLLAAVMAIIFIIPTWAENYNAFAEQPERMAALSATEDGQNFCVIPSLSPGATYTFSLYYKSDSYVYDPIKLFYQKDKNHTMQRIQEVNVNNELSWYKQTYTFTVPTNGYITGSGSKRATNILISISLGNIGNKSWVYDMCLTEESAPNDNLIKYPDFSRNFSSYYIYDNDQNYSTRIAGSKSKDTLEGCTLANVDMTIFAIPTDEQRRGNMVELVCPFPNASFCTLKNLTPGSTYKFSVYYATETSVAEAIKIFYQGSDAQWGLYQKIDVIEDEISDVYRHYVYEFTVPKNGKVINGKTSILISMSMGHVGKKGWVYDLKLTDVDDEEQTNLLDNPLFEENFTSYSIYNSNYINFTEGPTDSKFFEYDYSGLVTKSEILSVNMAKFEKPEPYAENRMLKIESPDAGGWFLSSAKAEIDKTYEFEINCRSKYIMRDLIGVFYEDKDRKIKRIQDAVVTEETKKHKYTVEFNIPKEDCYLQGNIANVFIGVNLNFKGTVPTSVALVNEIYIYEPILTEKGTTDDETNLVKDPYFKRYFSYCYTVNKNLSGRATGPIDIDTWSTFKLVDVDENVFNKNETPKMAHLVCTYWSANFITRTMVEKGKTYIFALDYFSESEIDEPIRLLYQGGADVLYNKILIDSVMTEDPDLNRYYYEFTVPEEENIPNKVELYCQVILGEQKEDAYVANLSLLEKDNNDATNLIINPDFSSNFYGYYYYNHEINTASTGKSDSNIFREDYDTVQVLDYDSTLFVKTEAERIIGTGWASEFGEIRVKKFGVEEDEIVEDDSSSEDEIVEDDYFDEEDVWLDTDSNLIEQENTNEDLVDNTLSQENQKPSKPRRKKRVVAVEEYIDYTWIVVVSVASGVLVLGGAVLAFVLIRRKKKQKANAKG